MRVHDAGHSRSERRSTRRLSLGMGRLAFMYQACLSVKAICSSVYLFPFIKTPLPCVEFRQIWVDLAGLQNGVKVSFATAPSKAIQTSC